jgi:hypothetical protein
MTKKLTPLTDPENIMVVWDDEAPEPPVKATPRKVAPRKPRTS